MEVLVWDRAVSADVVKARDASFASELVNQFGLPEKHHVLLVLCGFFNFRGEEVTCLLLFNFENFAKGTASELLYDFEAALKNLLVLR